MDERALKSWVSDKLHDILGFAEGALASYVIALGKKASDAGSLASQLASSVALSLSAPMGRLSSCVR